ncbi:MAG: amidohydrolase family protein [Novosphingobium sp.]|nr:amidohydrolase family protein [Novosphingobium sp.]
MTQARPIDADNHYYEPLDAFTRYQDKAMRTRGVQVVRDGKRVLVVIGEKVNRFIPNPTFDPVIVPGSIDLFFRGQVPEGVDPKSLSQIEPIHDEYMDRDKRIEVMDKQGLAACIMYPTMGVGVEEALKDDPEAAVATIASFNRWLEEDWGYNFKDRIIATPLISLVDVDAALKELDYVLSKGARGVHIRPAPVPAEGGNRSLGDPVHDPVWAAIAEANIPVFFHLGDSGYNLFAGHWGGNPLFQPFVGKPNPLDQLIVADRAIHDTMASLIVHGVFQRHPKLRVASIENGSDWVAILLKRMKKKANQMPEYFPDDPLDVMREHVWVAPYYEEDIRALADLIGTERVLFGSDWPHGEGLADPVAFVDDLKGFSEAEIARVMRTNSEELLGYSPAN